MNIALNAVHEVQLRMLKQLNFICSKHSIEYFLAQGTLLGAARHGGFIPWDDDIDILMDYKEIGRLKAVFADEAPENYFLTNHTVEKYYPFTWSKIRDTKTLSMPMQYEKLQINWGICIDLFPVYPLSDYKIVRNIEIFIFKISRKILLSNLSSLDKDAKKLNKILAVLPQAFKHFCADAGTSMFRRHKKATEYVFLTCKGGKIAKRNVIFGGNKKLFFEDFEYPVPNDYTSLLTQMYGNYEILPPKEERKGHELRLGDIVWKIN